MTGLYGPRINVQDVFFPIDRGGMTLGTPTLGSVLKGAGYRTMAIGKWHLGHTKPYLPMNRGFDGYYGVPYSVDMTPLPLIHNMRIAAREADRDELTQNYTRQAVDFIERSKDGPFFLYMAHSYPHIPLHASKKFHGSTKLGMYGDVVHEIDWSVGQVVNTLRRNGLEENTLVIFTSDHGPWFQGSTGNLRGRKATSWEGGVRIPMIASLPGALPRGETREALSSHVDFMPTLARLCDAEPPKGPLDGNDMWGMISGQEKEVERNHAILHFSDWDIECARWKQWKLHYNRENVPPFLPPLLHGYREYHLRNPELYHVIDDPKESYDVAAEHPDIVALIEKSFHEQLATMPDIVKQHARDMMQHVTSPLMPAGAYSEYENMKPRPKSYIEASWKTFEGLES